MPTLRLFVDVEGRQLVAGDTNSAPASLPVLYRGDSLTLSLKLLRPTGSLVSPFTVVPISGAALRVAIGTPGITSSVLTLQSSWTVDNTAQTYTGALPLDTPEILAAFTASGGAPLKLNFEIETSSNGVLDTVLQTGVTITEDIIKGSELPSESYTPPSALADNLALLLQNSPSVTVARNGDEFTFVSTVPAGPAGPAGTNGTNGVNGNLILTGASAPTAGTGSVNDWYINTATWMLYGPKGALGWPTGVSLIGPAGPQGPAGGGGGAASSGAQGAIQFSDGSGGFSGGSNATLDNAGALEANAVNFRRLRTRNISASNGGGLSGTITFDLGAGASVIKHDINGDATFAAANYTGGEMVSALITNTGGAAAVLTWDAALIFVGTKPSTLAAGKRLLLSITAYDGATLIAACAAEL